MEDFETVGEALSAMITLLTTQGQDMPPYVRQHLVDAWAKGSVDALVDGIGALYAARSELSASAVTLAIGMTRLASRHRFYGLGDDDKGLRMIEALRRDRGDEAITGFPWPDPVNDPAPDARFILAETE